MRNFFREGVLRAVPLWHSIAAMSPKMAVEAQEVLFWHALKRGTAAGLFPAKIDLKVSR